MDVDLKEQSVAYEEIPDEEISQEEQPVEYVVHSRLQQADGFLSDVIRAAISSPKIRKITHSPTNGRKFRDGIYHCVVASRAPAHYTIGRVMNRRSGKKLTRDQQLELLESDLIGMDLTGVPVDSCHHEKHVVGEILGHRWEPSTKSKWASFKLYENERGDRRPGQIYEAIRAGVLNGVSLTHYERRKTNFDVYPSELRPIGMAVCRVGARPGTKIHRGKKSDTPFADCIMASDNVAHSEHLHPTSCNCDTCQTIVMASASLPATTLNGEASASSPPSAGPEAGTGNGVPVNPTSTSTNPTNGANIPPSPPAAEKVMAGETKPAADPTGRQIPTAANSTFSGGSGIFPPAPGTKQTGSTPNTTSNGSGGAAAAAAADSSSSSNKTSTPLMRQLTRNELGAEIFRATDMTDDEKFEMLATLMGRGRAARNQNTGTNGVRRGAAAAAAAADPVDEEMEDLNRENEEIIKREARGQPHEEFKTPARNQRGQFTSSGAAAASGQKPRAAVDSEGNVLMSDAAEPETPQQSMARFRLEKERKQAAERKALFNQTGGGGGGGGMPPPSTRRPSSSAPMDTGNTSTVKASANSKRRDAHNSTLGDPSLVFGEDCKNGNEPFSRARLLNYMMDAMAELSIDETAPKRRPGIASSSAGTSVIRASASSGYSEDVRLTPAQQTEIDRIRRMRNVVMSPEEIVMASDSAVPSTASSTASDDFDAQSYDGRQSVVFALVRSTPEAQKILKKPAFAISLPLIGILNAVTRQNGDH